MDEEKIRQFFQAYPTVEEPKYYKMISKLKISDSQSIEVDYDDIMDYDDSFEMSKLVITKPYEWIKTASEIVEEMMGLTESTDLSRVRIINLPKMHTVDIRKIRAKHIGKLIQMDGIVKRVPQVKARIRVAVFKCRYCGEFNSVIQEDTNEDLYKPLACKNPDCNKGDKFTLLPHESVYSDLQLIKIQENPEKLKGGQEPQMIECILTDELVSMAIAGNRVTIIGILHPRQEIGVKGGKKATFSYYMHINNIIVKEKQEEDMELSKEEIDAIIEFSNDPNLISKITSAIAPNIWGYEHIKLAVALQMFSSDAVITPYSRHRGDTHILIAGDPGTGKSQILSTVQEMSPRSYLVSGEGITVSGLTAGVIREENSSNFALEAGAFALADGGVVCIDELDKAKPEVRDSMHRPMEQQQINIGKIINATINARCSVLAVCNPKKGRFDLYTDKTLADQIDLPPTLLSRFDLIFILRDVKNEKWDAEVAGHIFKVRSGGGLLPDVDMAFLKKYIFYAKTKVHPTLPPALEKKLTKEYVTIRQMGGENTIPITARQLEAIIRLALERSRMRLANSCSLEDIDEALKLYKKSMDDAMKDPETGEYDADVLFTGSTKSQKERMAMLWRMIYEENERLAKFSTGDEKQDHSVQKEWLFEQCEKLGWSKSKTESYIEHLKEKGEIYEPRSGKYIAFISKE
jgi:replicative DNA helicase Mcm